MQVGLRAAIQGARFVTGRPPNWEIGLEGEEWVRRARTVRSGQFRRRGRSRPLRTFAPALPIACLAVPPRPVAAARPTSDAISVVHNRPPRLRLREPDVAGGGGDGRGVSHQDRGRRRRPGGRLHGGFDGSARRNDACPAWHVDGLLLTGWDDMGTATLGPTLKAKLSTDRGRVHRDSSTGPASMESWVTSTLARAEGLMKGRRVFDGTGALDANGLAHAETAARRSRPRSARRCTWTSPSGRRRPSGDGVLQQLGQQQRPGQDSLVIALAVRQRQIGG
jgi:hypothetical protein